MAWVFGRLVLALIFAFFAVAAIAPKSAPAAEVTVILDRAKLIKLPEKVATIAVGNPLIADVSLLPGGVVVVTGKGYGVTNLIAIDRAGAVLMERSIEVQGPREHVVVVYRGAGRETYSCTPYCDARINLGDAKLHFETTLSQTAVRDSQAQANAPAK
jgi:hypothetical protein